MWYYRYRQIGNALSGKEEQTWVTREAKIRARRNSRKPPSILPRKNEK